MWRPAFIILGLQCALGCSAGRPAAPSSKVDAAQVDVSMVVDAIEKDLAVDVPDGFAPEADSLSILDLAGDSVPGELPGEDVAQPETDVAVDVPEFSTATGSAPVISVQPWPPACEDPHFVAESSKPIDGQWCWALPDSWCANASGDAAYDPACSPDGTSCCIFVAGCIPCGWISCFGCPGPGCAAQCAVQPNPWDGSGKSVWQSNECQAFSKVLAFGSGCAICGSDVYCPWVKTP